jgi:hypothetical protein
MEQHQRWDEHDCSGRLQQLQVDGEPATVTVSSTKPAEVAEHESSVLAACTAASPRLTVLGYVPLMLQQASGSQIIRSQSMHFSHNVAATYIHSHAVL